ncbi:hypothetical protein AgCh_003235 [Apium graveolens]
MKVWGVITLSEGKGTADFNAMEVWGVPQQYWADESRELSSIHKLTSQWTFILYDSFGHNITKYVYNVVDGLRRSEREKKGVPPERYDPSLIKKRKPDREDEAKARRRR